MAFLWTYPPEYISIVRESFLHILPQSELLGFKLQQRVVSEAPSLKVLFSNDFFRQQEEFVVALAWIIDHLDQPDTLALRYRLATENANFKLRSTDDLKLIAQCLLEEIAVLDNPELDDDTIRIWRLLFTSLIELVKYSAPSLQGAHLQT